MKYARPEALSTVVEVKGCEEKRPIRRTSAIAMSHGKNWPYRADKDSAHWLLTG
jgi:hypothetical protein